MCCYVLYIQARTGEARVDEVGAYGVAGNILERAFRCAESLSGFPSPSLFDNKQKSQMERGRRFFVAP